MSVGSAGSQNSSARQAGRRRFFGAILVPSVCSTIVSCEIDFFFPSVEALPADESAIDEPTLDADNSADREARMVKDVVFLPEPVIAVEDGLAVTLSFHALAAFD
jgi:hypothetical protein